MAINRSTLHHFTFEACIIGYVITLPYQAKFNSLFLILLIINWLVTPYLKQRLSTALSNKYVWLFISVYLVHLTGLLYTSNLATGNKILIKDISLLFFPLLLSTSKIFDSLKHKIFLALLTSLLAGTLVCYYLFNTNYLAVNDFYLTFSQGHFRDNFIKYIHIRPTYLTLYLIFSLITIPTLINFYWLKKRYIVIIGLGLVYVYFVLTSLLLSARMPLLAALILFIFLLTKYSLQKKFYWGIAAGLALVLSTIYISYNNPYFNKRFTEITETTLKPPTGLAHNSTNIRVGIIYCAYQVISANWLLGVGTGDSQDYLNNCYRNAKFSPLMYQDSYNLHNAFLEIWLKNGILAFILLICVFIIPLAISYKHGNYIYFSFLFIFALTSLTESTFNSQKGIVFFSFFNSLLAFGTPYFKPESNKTE